MNINTNKLLHILRCVILKFENFLLASFYASRSELINSPELSDGYSAINNTWEVIIKYTGTLTSVISALPNAKITSLFNGYGIIEATKEEIYQLSQFPEIIYIEKPKPLEFTQDLPFSKQPCKSLSPRYTFSPTSDFSFITTQAPNINDDSNNSNLLTGNGTLIAIIDSGIDFSHPDFRNPDGSSRILYLWDQTLSPSSFTSTYVNSYPKSDFIAYAPPYGYSKGILFNNSRLDQALSVPEPQRSQICPSKDLSGHGTHVAGIAAGNGNLSNGKYKGIAPESSLIVVKLGPPSPNGFPNTTQLMTAVNFSIEKSIELRMPLIINLSFGNVYGSHSGSSLLENYLDSVSSLYKTCIIAGTGNEGLGNGHSSGNLNIPNEKIHEFSVDFYETNINLQIWKNYWDKITFQLRSPSLSSVMIPSEAGIYRFKLDNTEIYVCYGEPSPYNIYQEIFINFQGSLDYVNAGIWQLIASPMKIQNGNYDLWLPASNTRNNNTQFLQPVPSVTLTLPSCASKIISVGAYDSQTDTVAPFSGRGFTWSTNFIKPELSAPGVNIISCAPNNGYVEKTGTSMATPFISGLCSLLMEWGIVKGNDSFLYGEKMKAFLISNTQKLPSLTVYPNPQIGWGIITPEIINKLSQL